jgi:hypothetical protein
MTTLTERAAQLAAAPANGTTPFPVQRQAAAEVELPDIDLDDALDPESAKLSAIKAWSRVRRDVRAVAKADQFTGGATYQFRGVERAINAFSPATLRHGVNVIPVHKESVYKETRTSGGKPQCDCTVTVTWHVYGPNDDFFVGESCGQATDTQDKASAKAQSVAFRVFLYEAGMIPTNEPEPENTAHDRGEAQARDPQDYFTEILKKSTSRERFQQIRKELLNLRLAREVIVNEDGEPEEVVAALDRIGKERFAPKAAGPVCDRCEKPGHHPDACPTLDGGAP